MGEIFLVPSARSRGSKHPKTQDPEIEDRSEVLFDANFLLN